MSTAGVASVVIASQAGLRLVAAGVVAVMLGSNAYHYQRAMWVYAAKATAPKQATADPASRPNNDEPGEGFARDGIGGRDPQTIDGRASNSR